jgi:tetratricopeptide (TPR) repeat protein
MDAPAAASIRVDLTQATIGGSVLVQLITALGSEQVGNIESILARVVQTAAADTAATAFHTALSRLAESAVDLQASAMDVAQRMQEVAAYLAAAPAADFQRFVGARALSFHLVLDFLVRRGQLPAHERDAPLAHATGLAFEALLDLKRSRECFVRASQLESRNPRYARTATESCLFCGLFPAAESHARHWHDLIKDEPGAHAEIAEALNGIGSAAFEQGRQMEAFHTLQAAVDSARLAAQPRLLSLTLNNLGAASNALDEPQRAERLLREALELREFHREPVKNQALTRNNLSETYRYLGQRDKAEEVLLDTMSLLHRELPLGTHGLRPQVYAQTLNNLGSLRLIEFGDAASALKYFEEALQSLKQLQDWAPNVAITLFNIGTSLVNGGRPQQAAEYYRRAIRGATQLYGADDPRTRYMAAEAARCGADAGSGPWLH